jgi:hypothetical protein
MGWTGFSWLRIGSSGVLLWTWWWTFRFHKAGYFLISWVTISFSNNILHHGVSSFHTSEYYLNIHEKHITHITIKYASGGKTQRFDTASTTGHKPPPKTLQLISLRYILILSFQHLCLPNGQFQRHFHPICMHTLKLNVNFLAFTISTIPGNLHTS